jgi:hypothetical protein
MKSTKKIIIQNARIISNNASNVGKSYNFIFNKSIIALLSLIVIPLGIIITNTYSLLMIIYYFIIWNIFIFIFHRNLIKDFNFAFLINSFFIVVYFIFQTISYPDSYGTTSSIGSWTDDSYFFALASDTIPSNLIVRDNYDLYTHPFSSIINFITIPTIHHPLDVIFFQSGVVGILASFSKLFMNQMTGNINYSRFVYFLTIVCPFMMMNGGLILVRDSLAAALLIYTLACINSRLIILAATAILLQIVIRPGTGLLLLPVYAIIYSKEIYNFVVANKLISLVCITSFISIFFYFYELIIPELDILAGGTSEGGGLSWRGRELFDGIAESQGGNRILLSIQELPLLLKAVLNAVYIFTYPFLNFKFAFPSSVIDIRALILNIVTPVYSIFLNGWFFAGILSNTQSFDKKKQIVIAVIVALVLIGVYSLQTRHKTIIYPLYYFIITIGFFEKRKFPKQIGFFFAIVLFSFELALNFR